ncbi:MAG: hypothetical protein R2764_22105 [Bacteroidales bacterium]
MAMMQIEVFRFTIYPTISQANFKFIFDDAEVKFAVVSNLEIYERIKTVIADSKTIEKVYSIDEQTELANWKRFISLAITAAMMNLINLRNPSIQMMWQPLSTHQEQPVIPKG